MAKVSIDDVSPQEWDAYNRKRINSMKDPDNYNKMEQQIKKVLML